LRQGGTRAVIKPEKRQRPGDNDEQQEPEDDPEQDAERALAGSRGGNSGGGHGPRFYLQGCASGNPAELPKSPKTAKRLPKLKTSPPDEPLHGATDYEIAKNAKLPPSPRKNRASGGPRIAKDRRK
jgi:hypothetical protein